MAGDLILNASELLRHLEAGSHFTVDSKTGDLKTESAALHALKNFFTTGKALRQRNEALRAKMADVLRDTGLKDLTEDFKAATKEAAHGKHLLADSARQKIIGGMNAVKAQILEKSAEHVEVIKVRASVTKQAQALPENCREPAARIVMASLTRQGLAANPEAARAASEAMFRDIQADKTFQALLAQCRFDEGRMKSSISETARLFPQRFLNDLASTTSHFKTGVHDSMDLDINRGYLDCINGQSFGSDFNAARATLCELLPDTEGVGPGMANPGWKMRTVVSMLAFQSGIGGASSMAQMARPEWNQLAEAGLLETFKGQTSSITVGPGKVVIETQMPVRITGSSVKINGQFYPMPQDEFTGYSYKVTVEVPLGQNLGPNELPAFTARVERGPNPGLYMGKRY
ncbi:MAG: hypothetical protein HUK26_05100 [Duodenibacillus sp.]|nr:hypothetical protein [Duodenibacillus sp.]